MESPRMAELVHDPPARLRLHPLNHRNYSSSKQLPTHALDLPSHALDRPRHPDRLPAIEREDQKNHQSYRMKIVNSRDRCEVIRKNASLKLLRREDELKGAKSRLEELKLAEGSAEAQSQNSIPAKRGQLLKRSHNYLRIAKRNDPEPQKSDISFEEGLEKTPAEEGLGKTHVPERIVTVEKEKDAICSENLLGNGLRKHSTVKMKALVTNPFERAMRQQEERQAHQVPPSEAERFKESQILDEDSCPSTTQQQELQELLRML